jgi:hypothetical protein
LQIIHALLEWKSGTFSELSPLTSVSVKQFLDETFNDAKALLTRVKEEEQLIWITFSRNVRTCPAASTMGKQIGKIGLNSVAR